MSWDGQERRARKRYGVRDSTVRYRKGGWASFLRPSSSKYHLLNVSEGGCHFITRDELPVGTELSLSMEAPGVRGVIRARGRVVWSRSSTEAGAWRVSVRFDPLGSRARALLKRILDGSILERVEVSTKMYLKGIEKL